MPIHLADIQVLNLNKRNCTIQRESNSKKMCPGIPLASATFSPPTQLDSSEIFRAISSPGSSSPPPCPAAAPWRSPASSSCSPAQEEEESFSRASIEQAMHQFSSTEQVYNKQFSSVSTQSHRTTDKLMASVQLNQSKQC